VRSSLGVAEALVRRIDLSMTLVELRTRKSTPLHRKGAPVDIVAAIGLKFLSATIPYAKGMGCTVCISLQMLGDGVNEEGERQ
jgi:hypothetical protein